MFKVTQLAKADLGGEPKGAGPDSSSYHPTRLVHCIDGARERMPGPVSNSRAM